MGTLQVIGNTRIISAGVRIGIAIPLTIATWNPLDKHSFVVLSNGNLTAANSTPSNTRVGIRATNSVSAGKYYWETTLDQDFASIGIAKSDWPVSSSTIIESDPTQITYYSFDGSLFTTGSPVIDSWVTTDYNIGDIVSVALDATAGKIWFGVNGVWLNVVSQNDPSTGANPAATFTPGVWFAAAFLQQFATAGAITTNFGLSAFSGTVPSGYNAGYGL